MGENPFGSPGYAKEELIAELSAAVIASQHGLSKHIKNDSAQYLKSWLGSLKESPEFLKTVLGDVKRSTGMINQRLEAIQVEMDKGEAADYSMLRSGVSVHAYCLLDAASKQPDQETTQTHHRSR